MLSNQLKKVGAHTRPSWADQKQSEFESADLALKWLNRAAVGLLIACAISFERAMRFSNYDLAVYSLGTFGLLVSVLVISHVAEREIVSQQVHFLMQRDENRVQKMHYSLSMLDEIIVRVTIQRDLLTKGGAPTEILARNMKKIEKTFDKFINVNLYDHLPGTLFSAISRITTSFLTIDQMTTTCIRKNSENNILRPADVDLKKIIGSNFELVLTDLKTIENQILERRISLTTPDSDFRKT